MTLSREARTERDRMRRALARLLAVSDSTSAEEGDAARAEAREALRDAPAMNERLRVQERLLARGNTLAGVVAALLHLLAADREPDPVELEKYAAELESWTADVRAVASEDAP